VKTNCNPATEDTAGWRGTDTHHVVLDGPLIPKQQAQQENGVPKHVHDDAEVGSREQALQRWGRDGVSGTMSDDESETGSLGNSRCIVP
jgi:hypothetical protein